MSKAHQCDPVLDAIKANGLGKSGHTVGNVQTRNVNAAPITPSFGMSFDQAKSPAEKVGNPPGGMRPSSAPFNDVRKTSHLPPHNMTHADQAKRVLMEAHHKG